MGSLLTLMLVALAQASPATDSGVALIISSGAVITAAGALIGFGSLKNKVDNHDRQLASTPTRDEFNESRAAIHEIRQDVKELIRRTRWGDA